MAMRRKQHILAVIILLAGSRSFAGGDGKGVSEKEVGRLRHLACIMDGNRRWAKRQGKPQHDGHREGANAVCRVIDACAEHHIDQLSLYAFSLENFKRSEIEKRFIFDLLVKGAQGLYVECQGRGARMRFIGDRSLFPQDVIETCQELEKETAAFKAMQVNLLFGYGAQQEMLSAFKRAVADAQSGKLEASDVSQETLEQYLWTVGTPPPDLILRTGGDRRQSNFLLYQAAYSELCFLDCLWPDMGKQQMDSVIADFYARKRNFGA